MRAGPKSCQAAPLGCSGRISGQSGPRQGRPSGMPLPDPALLQRLAASRRFNDSASALQRLRSPGCPSRHRRRRRRQGLNIRKSRAFKPRPGIHRTCQVGELVLSVAPAPKRGRAPECSLPRKRRAPVRPRTVSGNKTTVDQKNGFGLGVWSEFRNFLKLSFSGSQFV